MKNFIHKFNIKYKKILDSSNVLESDRNSHPKASRINQSESDRNSQS